jgi:hypothetical protein
VRGFRNPERLYISKYPVNDGYLFVRAHLAEVFLEVVGDEGPRPFNGKEFVFDGMLARR